MDIGASVSRMVAIVPGRFLLDAPSLAPLLFTSMEMLGSGMLMDPEEG